jgi:hypothetical protein
VARWWSGTDQQECWCPKVPIFGVHSRPCLTARAALAGTPAPAETPDIDADILRAAINANRRVNLSGHSGDIAAEIAAEYRALATPADR